MREAAVLANVAASVVVGEVGTAPITSEKLLRAVERHDSEQEVRRSRRRSGGAPLP
jgi:bifunctional ADP-heptose synthase (sugar kinase/adenylyltransferase)